jgi:hypothetical protein
MQPDLNGIGRAGYALGPSNMRRASETLPLSLVRIIIVEIVSTVQKM